MTKPATSDTAGAHALDQPSGKPMRYPIILGGDRAAYELENANTPAHERSDWPLPSFDARDWAAAFCKIAKTHGHDLDEGWMISWFANALMRGYDECTAQSATSSHALDPYTVEKCAKVAEAWFAIFNNVDLRHTSPQKWANDAVLDIAEAIRALQTAPPPPAPAEDQVEEIAREVNRVRNVTGTRSYEFYRYDCGDRDEKTMSEIADDFKIARAILALGYRKGDGK